LVLSLFFLSKKKRHCKKNCWKRGGNYRFWNVLMVRVTGRRKKKKHRIWRRGERVCGTHLTAFNVIPNHIFLHSSIKN